MKNDQKYILDGNVVIRAEDRQIMAAISDQRLIIFIDEDLEAKLMPFGTDSENSGGEFFIEVINGGCTYKVFRKADNRELLNAQLKEFENVFDGVKIVFDMSFEDDYYKNNSFIYSRMINSYIYNDGEEVLKLLAKLSPDLEKEYDGYLKALKDICLYEPIWSQDWIGVMDIEKNYLIIKRGITSANSFSLLHTGHWSLYYDLDYDSQCFWDSNVLNQFVYSECEGELTKELFLKCLKNILSGKCDTGVKTCKISFEEMKFNFEEMAERINGLDLGFRVNGGELEWVVNEIRRDAK